MRHLLIRVAMSYSHWHPSASQLLEGDIMHMWASMQQEASPAAYTIRAGGSVA